MNSFNFKSVRHALFDAYGTLFDVHSAASRYKDRLGQHSKKVSAIWRTKQLEYTWLRSMMHCYVDFWEVTKDALDYSLELHGVDDNILRKDLLRAYFELSCYPEVPDTLKKIKQMGLGTAILSNGTPKMLKAGVTNSNVGKVLDSIISAHTIKVFKPSPKVYQLATEQLDCMPEEILFFSSNAWDVSGAATFGFKTVWVNRFGQAHERLPGIPIMEINTLDSILR